MSENELTFGYDGSSAGTEELSTELPIARVKRIMKLGEGVKMVSNEAAVKLAYTVDLLLADITKRAWACATQNHRRTFLKWDIQEALIDAEHLDFLIDIVPTNETRQQKKEKKPTATQENFTQQIIAKMQIPLNKTVYMHIMRDMHIPPMPQPQQQYIRIQPQPTYQFVMNPDPSSIVQLHPQQMFTTSTIQTPTGATAQPIAFAPQNGFAQMLLLNQPTQAGQIIQSGPQQIVETAAPQIVSHDINGTIKVSTKHPSNTSKSSNEPKSKKVKVS